MSRRAGNAEVALEAVFRETVSLFHRLRATAEEIHREHRVRGGERGILRSLQQHGPQTIPQLARARPVSRQHIQAHVTPLAERGLVEFRPNPAHRKSYLVTLTERGRALIGKMEEKEKRFLAALPLSVGEKEISRAVHVLQEVRKAFESGEGKAVTAGNHGNRKGRTVI